MTNTLTKDEIEELGRYFDQLPGLSDKTHEKLKAVLTLALQAIDMRPRPGFPPFPQSHERHVLYVGRVAGEKDPRDNRDSFVTISEARHFQPDRIKAWFPLSALPTGVE